MADEEAKVEEAQTQAQTHPQIQVDDSHIVAGYANFCRVSSTPEELILDLGLNTEVTPAPDKPIKLEQRIVLNFYTAKRLLHAVAAAVQRHEQVFGTLEVDIRKRATPSGR